MHQTHRIALTYHINMIPSITIQYVFDDFINPFGFLSIEFCEFFANS